MSELQLLIIGEIEKTNLCFTLLAVIRFFVVKVITTAPYGMVVAMVGKFRKNHWLFVKCVSAEDIHMPFLHRI